MKKEPSALPQWQGQHRAHEASEDWPYLGRDALDHGHAIFAIAEHLRSLGLQTWTERLVQWLARYDGFECYVEEDAHDPILSVRDLIMQCVLRQGSERAEAIAPSSDAGREHRLVALKHSIVDGILALDFLRYRAFWGPDPVPRRNSRHWQPLKQSWLAFIESRRAGELLWVWLSPREPEPPLHVLRSHLLAT